MGRDDKIPLSNEKKIKYVGLFEPRETYHAVRGYLETSRHYDTSEKDLVEKNVGGSRELVSFIEAEQEYTDYYKIIIAYRIEMSGKEVEVKMDGRTQRLTEGTAILIINTFAVVDFMGKRSQSALMGFASKIYDKYFGQDELGKVMIAASDDVNGMVTAFRHQMNSQIK